MVGSTEARGISGGERKRLTTAEIFVAQQPVVFMDEISTGLDSATTYSVVRTFRCGNLSAGLPTASFGGFKRGHARMSRRLHMTRHGTAPTNLPRQTVPAVQGRGARAGPHLPHLPAAARPRSDPAV